MPRSAPREVAGGARELWHSYVRWEGGADGHAWWVGPQNNGRAVVYAGGRIYYARRLAYRLTHGQEPEGLVRAGCGRPACVAPAHQEDARGRQERLARVAAAGGVVMPPQCVRGHDMARTGVWVTASQYRTPVRARCLVCMGQGSPRSHRRSAERAVAVTAALAGGPMDGLPRSVRCQVAAELYRDGAGAPVAEIAQRLGVTERSVWRYLAEARREEVGP